MNTANIALLFIWLHEKMFIHWNLDYIHYHICLQRFDGQCVNINSSAICENVILRITTEIAIIVLSNLYSLSKKPFKTRTSEQKQKAKTNKPKNPEKNPRTNNQTKYKVQPTVYIQGKVLFCNIKRFLDCIVYYEEPYSP